MSSRGLDNIYLVGTVDNQILGSKLPSNRQVLSVFFYNMRIVKLSARESASLAIREAVIFWEKSRIPTRAVQHCIQKLLDMYEVWRNLQKSSKKVGEVFRQKEAEFIANFDNLFDIAHSDALKIIKIEEDKQFLIAQRQPGRKGCLGGIDKNLESKEKRSEKRKREEFRRKRLYEEKLARPSTSTSLSAEDTDSDSANQNIEEGNQTESIDTEIDTSKLVRKRGHKNFITPKLVAALDRCQLSVRDSVYILQATAEALGLDVNELVINSTSIYRCRESLRAERAESIKMRFKGSLPKYIVVHWDGKLLPALNTTVERLPIVVTSKDTEQLLAVPSLESSTGEEQAQAIYNALREWELTDIVQALCCDTTASNTGRLNGACVLLEQKLQKDILYLPCRHHIYELVLRGVFEAKIPQISSSPNVFLFKNFKQQWSTLNHNDFENGMTNHRCCVGLEDVRIDILNFAASKLKETHCRHDYRELLELIVIFLNGDEQKTPKIRPPGAMHHARWMARAIYSLKIFLYRKQYKISAEEEILIADICIFIIKFYVKAWFECPIASKAPVHDIRFMKNLKDYENIDRTISQAAIKKMCGHMWYLTEEAAAFAFFDDSVTAETKRLMVKALSNESNPTKRLMIQPKDVDILASKFLLFCLIKFVIYGNYYF